MASPPRRTMRQTDSSLRLVREALDSVVSPAVRDVLLECALGDAGDVPADPESFLAFVDGPLRQAMTVGLGAEMAESIVDELRGVASQLPRRASRRPPRSLSPIPRPPARTTPPRRLSSRQPEVAVPPSAPVPTEGLGRGVWRSDEYPSGVAAAMGMVSQPAPPLGSGRPLVFIATRDADRLQRLSALLGERVEVAQLVSLRELILCLEAAGEVPVAVLVDCASASVRPEALAAVAEDLGPRVKVLLWGATPEIQRSVLRISPVAARFLACAAAASEPDVAVRCVALVG